MNSLTRNIIKYLISIKKVIHSNIYMIIGCYGVLAIIVICFSTKWFFHAQLSMAFPPSLPPAWQNAGDVNHVLGTDEYGRDIFNYLLIAYKSTIVLTLRATSYVIILGALINYLMFFISPIRIVVMTLFKVIIAIPPLLSAIVVTLLWGENINAILIILGLSYSPRFIHNIHRQVMLEWQKTYIAAHRLDGLPTSKIINFYIIPNIFPTYLTEVVALFSYILLAITILSFLGFGSQGMHNPDLGIMMGQMLDMMHTNYWAFIATGIVIIITILVIHLFSIGVHTLLAKRGGDQ